MTLQTTLNDNHVPHNNIACFRNSLISAYPYTEPAIVKKANRKPVNHHQKQNNLNPHFYNYDSDKNQKAV
jgi:hypothetical protein